MDLQKFLLFCLRKTNQSTIMKYFSNWSQLPHLPLYPHDFNHLVILVPNQLIIASADGNAFKIFLFISIWLGPILFTFCFRCYFHKVFPARQNKKWFDVLFDSYRLTLCGNSEMKVSNKTEQVLIMFLRIYAMLTGILCSGLLFQLYTSDTIYTPKINTIQDLRESKLDIQYPWDLLEDYAVVWIKNE